MKQIAFITCSRSDYTSLEPVIDEALQSKELSVDLVVAGSHFLKRFGSSYQQIKQKYQRLHEIRFLNEEDDSEQHFARAYALATERAVQVFTELKPDLIFILGDRWEMLAFAGAASILQIPIVHHSGGDLTQGAFDNQIRYAISSLAHLHLVALDQHKERLEALGEEPWRVTATGEPALTKLSATNYRSSTLRSKLGLADNSNFVLATYHPCSYERYSKSEQIEIFIKALSHIKLPVLITAPNPDPGSKLVLSALQKYVENANNRWLRFNLGSELYYAAMANACYMIGNSSSGVWEAASFSLPVINIGIRQEGRTRADNVKDVALDLSSILQAIDEFQDQKVLERYAAASNIYQQSDCLEKIIDTLINAPAKDLLLAKKLVDPLASRPVRRV